MDPVIKRMGKRGHGAVINVIGSGGKSLRRRTCRRRRQRGAAPSDRRARLRLCIERGQGRRRESRRDQTERVAQGLKAEAKRANVTEEQAYKQMIARLPMGRPAEPDEIANIVVFAASERGRYLTGANISTDGAASHVVI